MIRYLDDRCLSNFVATYEAKNLRLAADKVGLTQPAMSKSLSRLEGDVGVRLFERKNRGLEPTPAAHELYDCAIKIELSTRQSMLRISNLDANISGTIRIGAGHMWSWLRMPQVLHQFLGRFPNVEVDLITAPMKLLVAQLNAGHIDVAVGEMSDIQSPNGFAEFSFPPVLQWAYVRAEHPLAKNPNVLLADLVSYPWTGFSDNKVFPSSVADACTAAGVSLPKVPLRSGSLAAIMSMASMGDYVIILPDDFGPTAEKFGLVRVASESLQMWNLETSVIYNPEEYSNGPIGNLVELMKSLAPGMP